MKTRNFLLSTVLLAAAASSAQAASVIWGTPTNITGPSDIITTGTLVAAVNGSIGGDIVVDPGGLNMTFTPDNTWFPTQNPFVTSFAPTSGDAGFDAVMNTADWGNTPTQGTVVNIGGLTIGQTYAIQMFVADTRSCCNGRSMEITGGLNTVSVYMGDNAGTPNPAQFVVGTFTADDTLQGFAFTGTHPTAANLRHPQLNAYVLRQIPEPAALGLLAFCSVGAFLRRRR